MIKKRQQPTLCFFLGALDVGLAVLAVRTLPPNTVTCWWPNSRFLLSTPNILHQLSPSVVFIPEIKCLPDKDFLGPV